MLSEFLLLLAVGSCSSIIIKENNTAIDDSCGVSFCNNNGYCKKEINEIICVCNSTYTGSFCEIRTEDCFLKGDCETRCPPFSTGKTDCEPPVTCQSLKCGPNGVCIEIINGTDEYVFCKCFEGFDGEFCDSIAPTEILYYETTEVSMTTNYLMSAVVGITSSIATFGLVVITGVIIAIIFWKYRRRRIKKSIGRILEDDFCNPQVSLQLSSEENSHENITCQLVDSETVEHEVIQSSNSDCAWNLPLMTIETQEVEKDSIVHEDPSVVSYPIISKNLEDKKNYEIRTSFIEHYSKEFSSTGGQHCTNLFGMFIPSGSIPQNKIITIDIGITFCTELMSLLPPEFKAVSPIVKVCIKEEPDFRFLKPIKIQLQHYLDLQSEGTSNSINIHFLKSGHNLSCFHVTDGVEEFDCNTQYGKLIIDHFCTFCIAADKTKIDPCSIYCHIIRVIPRQICRPKWDAIYCVALYTCTIIVEKQYNSADFEVRKIKLFRFNRLFSDQPYLELDFERQSIGCWNLTLQYATKITASDLDYTLLEPVILECMEKDHLYPPRYTINISSRSARFTTLLDLHFTGAIEHFKTELLLEHTEWRDSISSGIESMTKLDLVPTHLELMNRVAASIPTKWRNLGIQLGLAPNDLDMFEARHGGDYHRIYSCIFTAWENQVTRPFTWETIIQALKAPLLAECKLADEMQTALYLIARDSHTRNSSGSGVGLMQRTTSIPSIDSFNPTLTPSDSNY